VTRRERASKLLVAPAIYGASVGAVHSIDYAALNVVKFPLLIWVSAIVCSGSHYMIARFFGLRLSFGEIRALVFEAYGDLSVMLASLSTVLLFFALTFEPPRTTFELGEYPWFLALNVLLIGALGSLALFRQCRAVLRRSGTTPRRAIAVVSGWLAASLLVGGQWAWYLRPFFGNRAIPADGSFCLGASPDFRGAASFFEAVSHLIAPP
jgi:hypothetical protein